MILLGAAIGFGAVVACSGDILQPPPSCSVSQCTCEEDPSQALCKGFNDRPEGGSVNPFDASVGDAADGSTVDAPVAPDAAADGPDDSGDDAG